MRARFSLKVQVHVAVVITKSLRQRPKYIFI